MKDEILNYIGSNNYIEIPTLQDKFNLSYKEAKAIIDELVASNILVYDSGLKYSYLNALINSGNDTQYHDIDSKENQNAIMREYLEKRRQELMESLQAESTESDDGDDIDNVMYSEDELRIKALRYCFEEKKASISMLQNAFSIGFARANRLILWMENMEYISKGNDRNPRKILISQKELDKIVMRLQRGLDDVNDDFDDDDDEQNDSAVDLRPILIRCFEHGLQFKSDGENYVLGLNGELTIELKFKENGGALVLSDGGKTILKTRQRSWVIKKVLKNFPPVDFKSDEIYITVDNPRGVLMALLILYSAIDAIIKMK